jgi:predicted nuclease with TOPRIM domain
MSTKIKQLEVDIANLEEAQKTLRMEIRDVKWRIKELKAEGKKS